MRTTQILGLATAMAFFGTLPVHGQFHLGKDKDKEASMKEREEKRDAKNTRTYEKVKTYAQEKYASDPDFRDEVDEGYAEVLRLHNEQAFDRNIHRKSTVYAVHEDRFRLHEGLYDNLLVQDHINRIGQHLVPEDSDRVFAFRLLPDPTPTALTLATGTIYISTGMISMLDSEAQLAYVLAHEMAHVQLDHWREKVLMEKGVEAYNSDQAKKTERVALVAGLAGGLIGGLATKSASGALGYGVLGGVAGALISNYLINPQAVVQWDKVQEDEADKLAFKAMLNAQYDVREIPKLYVAMETLTTRDRRMTLGFLGDRTRVKQRKENADKLIQEAYKAEIELQLKKGFIGDTAGHRNLMAELKRDNGIMAYYHDMFLVARKNLAEAVAIRENDSAAQYYYGKVLKLTGRTDEDQKLAVQSFVKAAQYDVQQENFGSHLHYALSMIESGDNPDHKLVTSELDNYVTSFARYNVEYQKTLLLPPNMDTMYEYMALYGDANWRPKLPPEAELGHVNYNRLPTNPDKANQDLPQLGSNPPAAAKKRPTITPVKNPLNVVKP